MIEVDVHFYDWKAVPPEDWKQCVRLAVMRLGGRYVHVHAQVGGVIYDCGRKGCRILPAATLTVTPTHTITVKVEKVDHSLWCSRNVPSDWRIAVDCVCPLFGPALSCVTATCRLLGIEPCVRTPGKLLRVLDERRRRVLQ